MFFWKSVNSWRNLSRFALFSFTVVILGLALGRDGGFSSFVGYRVGHFPLLRRKEKASKNGKKTFVAGFGGPSTSCPFMSS